MKSSSTEPATKSDRAFTLIVWLVAGVFVVLLFHAGYEMGKMIYRSKPIPTESKVRR